MAQLLVEEKCHAYRDQDQDYSEDGTVDLKGRPVLRAETGRWKACYFIIGTLTLLLTIN